MKSNIKMELKNIESKQRKITSKLKQIIIQIVLLITYLVILTNYPTASKLWGIGVIIVSLWIYKSILQAEKALKELVSYIEQVQKTPT